MNNSLRGLDSKRNSKVPY